jgi:putative ABC transport system permease protein
MIKNYLKTAWRGMVKNKISSFINIAGLAVGLCVTMLIGLWIYDELSFNTYHKNYDRVGQIMIHNGDGTYNELSIPLATDLRSNFTGDFKSVVLATEMENHILSFGDKKFIQVGTFMQPEAPDMFTLKMISGNRSGLQGPNSILIKESLAKKLFGSADPVDKIVRIDNEIDVKVTGVFADLPGNSFLKDMAFMAPWDLYVLSNDQVKKAQNDWKNNGFNIYVQLSNQASFDGVSSKIRDLKLQHTSKLKAEQYKPALFIHPMSKWHLYSKFDNRVLVTSEELKLVLFYGIIGAFVLLLACINFMNLSTAHAAKRAKEVGIRKAIGSSRAQLIRQFFVESILVTLFAFFLALVLTRLSLPWFNSVSGKSVVLPWKSFEFWAAGITIIGLTGLMAGSYPALYLSSFIPVKVLKGRFRAGRFAAVPRKILVVLQFTVSIALLISTIVVYDQIQFARSRPLGYARRGLIAVDMTTQDFQGKYDVLRSELKNTGAVLEMAESGSSMTDLNSETGSMEWKSKDPNMESSFATIPITVEYGNTIGWKIVDGRDFSRDFPTDSACFVINEAAAKYMGLKNPVGEILSWKPYGDKIERYQVIGVAKDMIMNSPFKPAYPTVFFLRGGMEQIFVRIDPKSNPGIALPKIEAVFKKWIPSAPFAYHFVDEEYGFKFAAEQRIGELSGFFAVLAVFISCLGLFGLASFMAEQRAKEIGLRKVLGASVINLWHLAAKEFMGLVFISILIASPIDYYFMNHWLENYEYRTSLSWWIFASAGGGAMMITLLTVSYKAIKAAIASPIQSLRTE